MNQIIIFAEHTDGIFKKQALEVVSYGVRLAELLGYQSAAVAIGNVEPSELKNLGKYGAEKILHIQLPGLDQFDARIYSGVLADLVMDQGGEYFICSTSNIAKAVAPRVAVRIKAGLVFGTTGLPVNLSPVTFPKKVYHGKALSEVQVLSERKVICLAQNAFGVAEKPVNPEIITITSEFNRELVKTRVTGVEKSTGKVLLNEAEIIVSGGRGMKGPQNWKPLEELAELLGAALACSRPVSDEGWRPHSEHVGQTGKIVAPNLYMAFGISGAIQHLAGVSSSKFIVAVNTDKEAPIFSAADYGIVGDAAMVLPRLIEALKKFKSEG